MTTCPEARVVKSTRSLYGEQVLRCNSNKNKNEPRRKNHQRRTQHHRCIVSHPIPLPCITHKTIAPASTPPATRVQTQTTAPSCNPANRPAAALPVSAGAGACVPDEAAVEVAAAAPDVVEEGTLLTSSLPHSLQSEEPGVSLLQTRNCSWQTKLGRVSRYWSIERGAVPLVQVQVYFRVSYGERLSLMGDWDWGWGVGRW